MAKQKTQRVKFVFDDIEAMERMLTSALGNAGHYERVAQSWRRKAAGLENSIAAAKAGKPIVTEVDLPI